MASNRSVLTFLCLLFVVYMCSLVAIYWLYERQLRLHTYESEHSSILAQVERKVYVTTDRAATRPTNDPNDAFLTAMHDLQEELAAIEAQRETQRRKQQNDASSDHHDHHDNDHHDHDHDHDDKVGHSGDDVARSDVRESKRGYMLEQVKVGLDGSAVEGGEDLAGARQSGVRDDDHGGIYGKKKTKRRKKAIVVLGHNRPALVERILLAFAEMKHIEDYTVYLSVDSTEKLPQFQRMMRRPEIERLVQEMWVMPQGFRVVTHPWQTAGLFKISEHFRFVLQTAFERFNHTHLILQEDDLLPGRDFLVLFNRTQWLLDTDPSVWCISAWNDYCFRGVAQDPAAMLKTDFFPGLGWMLKRELWIEELRDVWPKFATTGWDHWMRLGPISKGRVCVIPEVSRNKHVSEKGTNVRGKQIKVFKEYVSIEDFGIPPHAASPLESFDVRTLQEPVYTEHLKQLVANAQKVTIDRLKHPQGLGDKHFLLLFTREEFPRFKPLKLLQEPRVTFKGLIKTRFFADGRILLMADRREASTFLPQAELIEKNENVEVHVSNRGENCHSACQRHELKCSERDMYFVNNCKTLLEHFECKGGCGNQQGKELPCHVVGPDKETFGQCLVSTDTKRRNCASKHASTERVCACVP